MTPVYADDYDDSVGASCSNQNACTSSVVSSDDNTIEIAISAANLTSNRDVCTNLMLHPDRSNTALTLEQENRRKKHFGVENDYSEELEWQSTKFFR